MLSKKKRLPPIESLSSPDARWRAVKPSVLAIFLSLIVPLFGSPAAAAETPAQSLLIINQSDTSRPWPNAIIAGIRATVLNNSNSGIQIYVENLDLYRFKGEGYETSLRDFFQRKYQDKPIGAIIVIGPAAVAVMLRLRDSLWPTASVIFAAVDDRTAAQKFPAGVTGITMRMTLADMVETTRRLLPQTKRIAIVGDLLNEQLYYKSFPAEVVHFQKDFEFIDLTGLPLDEVRQRVAGLPDDAVIFYVGINAVRSASYAGAEVLPLVAEVADRPIIVNTETYIGSGAVGGYLLAPGPIGDQTARLALRVLAGENASEIPITSGPAPRPIFDWRQLERWNISEVRLPLDSEIRFQPPGFWEQYRWQFIIGLTFLLVQAALIAGLLAERHRRQSAEKESRRQSLRVMHLNRSATAGVFSASIAHELNQPLGAILANAETAGTLLSRASPDLPQVRDIIADIRRDDERASDILKHLRSLFSRGADLKPEIFDIDRTIRAAAHILEPEAAKRGVTLEIMLARGTFLVRADPVHLEQVLLNLAVNGMDAMSNSPPSRRRLEFRTALSGDSDIEVSVSDRGTGIPQDQLDRIFDSFYTTKEQGTGLGLAICRTIIETYGGRIWADNRKEGGAIFRFTLPATQSFDQAGQGVKHEKTGHG